MHVLPRPVMSLRASDSSASNFKPTLSPRDVSQRSGTIE
jgi:hypothetical protein